MSKFDIAQQIITNPSREILESILHDDFFLVREEGLETRQEFIYYVFANTKVGNGLIEGTSSSDEIIAGERADLICATNAIEEKVPCKDLY